MQTHLTSDTLERLSHNSNLLGSVFVKASWHSGGALQVEAKAWSSAEVDAALSSSFGPVREESESVPEETRKQENDHRDKGHYLSKGFLIFSLFFFYFFSCTVHKLHSNIFLKKRSTRFLLALVYIQTCGRFHKA